MRRINYFAAILVAPTLLYAALVILNPFNYFVDGKGESPFAIAYVVAPYPGKAAAIQLIGTTMIAFGIIVSQEKPIVRVASLLGTVVVWLGLVQGMLNNSLLVGTTLVFFVGLTLLQGIGIGIYMLATTIGRLVPPVVASIVRLADIVQQRVAYSVRSTGNRISGWAASVWRTARQLWPF